MENALPDENFFAPQLRKLRMASGFSQADLAAKLGKNQRTISTWETGRQEPCIADIAKLGVILGCSIDDLFGRGELAEPAWPQWLADLLPDLKALDRHGREAVKALIKGLKNKV